MFFWSSSSTSTHDLPGVVPLGIVYSQHEFPSIVHSGHVCLLESFSSFNPNSTMINLLPQNIFFSSSMNACRFVNLNSHMTI